MGANEDFLNKCKTLSKTSKQFEKKISDLPTIIESFKSVKNNQEHLNYLKKLNEILDSKLKCVDTEFAIENIEASEPSEDEIKGRLIEKVLQKTTTKDFVTKIEFGEKIKNIFSHNSKNIPQEYKDEILGYVDKIRDTNDVILKLTEEQSNLTSKLTEMKLDTKYGQAEYKKHLESYQQKEKSDLSEENQIQMKILEKRVDKINFMKTLVKELLVMKDFSENERAIEIFESLRHPTTIDNVLDSTE